MQIYKKSVSCGLQNQKSDLFYDQNQFVFKHVRPMCTMPREDFGCNETEIVSVKQYGWNKLDQYGMINIKTASKFGNK